MSKFTPGPWHWDSDPMTGDPLGRVRYRVTTVGKTITQIYHSSGHEESEADARLIASAPDMWEALQLCVNAFGGTYEDEKRAFEAGMAALAKAEGR